MSGPNALLLELVEATAEAVIELRGESDERSLKLRQTLSSLRLVNTYTSVGSSPKPDELAVIRDAAHTVNGLDYGPFNAIIANSIEQIVEDYSDLVGDDLEGVALIRSAIERGIEIANTRLGDLA